MSLDASNSEIRSFDLRQPLFFSFVVHLLIFVGLRWEFHQPKRRPIKEVNVWVGNLVSEWNAEPKGQKEGNIEGVTLALPSQRERSDRMPPLPAEKQPLYSSTGKMEDRLRLMRDAADQQIKMGKYLFTLKAMDQMVGIKIRHFQKNVRLSLEGILKASIPEEERIPLKGKTGAVRVSFRAMGRARRFRLPLNQTRRWRRFWIKNSIGAI